MIGVFGDINVWGYGIWGLTLRTPYDKMYNYTYHYPPFPSILISNYFSKIFLWINLWITMVFCVNFSGISVYNYLFLCLLGFLFFLNSEQIRLSISLCYSLHQIPISRILCLSGDNAFFLYLVLYTYTYVLS